MKRLAEIGNVPVSGSLLASLYPEISAGNKKVAKLESDGCLIRLKRGLYVISPEISGRSLSLELIANAVYAPSYVSMHSALRYYGLIPETVFTMKSVTIKHSRTFENAVGRFEYVLVSRDIFPIGITRQTVGEAAFVIATPEKSLCDLISATSGLTLRYKVDALRFLEDDLRLDMDSFARFRRDIFEEYVRVGKKQESIRTLLKLL